MTTTTTIRRRLLATCRLYGGSDSRGIVMRCGRCGKHFAVDAWTVANYMSRGQVCECSPCGTATLEPVRKGDKQ